MNLKGLLDSLINNEDLKEYDLVSSLSVDMEDDGNIILFVAKDGEGEIIEMSKEDFHAQLADAEGSISTVSSMYFADVKGKQDYAAQFGADQLAANAGVYFQSGVKVQGLDLENPDQATAKMLPEIKDALWNVRADLTSGAASPEYDQDGNWTLNRDEAAIAALPAVEEALNLAQNALNLDIYVQQLKDALPGSNVPEAIKNDILLSLESGDDSLDEVKAAPLKIGQ